MTKQDRGMKQTLVNATMRRLATMFPGYWAETKHNHYADFGWPTTLNFQQLHAMYQRNGLAKAAVVKSARKVWETAPVLRSVAKEGQAETPEEKAIRLRFDDLRLWQRCAETHRRAMVGGYAGLILRLGDDRLFREPVESVRGGLDGLAEVIPAWAGQLTVAEWDTDERSDTYGQPLMFNFVEAQVLQSGNAGGRNRAFEIHPDRVVIWSEDGTVHCPSLLEPGFNDLLTLEKITGSGGEGFWKNAKSAPVLQVDKEARLAEMARAMGVAEDGLVDAMNDQVEDWQKGFDKLLMIQGIEAKTLGITLPSPEHFRAGALEDFAASVEIPIKILVGMQTGERASKEDAEEWARTSMGRRSDFVSPAIMEMVRRFERFGMLPDRDWWLEWADLTEAGMAEKIDRAVKMADANQKMAKGGELVFLPEEIRAAVDLDPLTEAQKYRPDDDPSLREPTDDPEEGAE